MVQRPIVAEFMKRLQEAENNKDVKTLEPLFTEDAELLNLTRPMSRSTPRSESSAETVPHAHSSYRTNGSTLSARAFWSQYLHAFDYVNSHFTNVIDDGTTAVLEWHSTGCLPTGLPIDYAGISIIECNGDKIVKFRTYYDSAAFLPHTPTQSKTYSESVGRPEVTDQVSS